MSDIYWWSAEEFVCGTVMRVAAEYPALKMQETIIQERNQSTVTDAELEEILEQAGHSYKSVSTETC